MLHESEHIILFDGVCNLCNRVIQFTIRHDKKKQFKFAALQSEKGQQLLIAGGFVANKTDSFVLIIEGKYYTQSTAALRILKALGAPWQIFYAFIIIPKFLRDSIYNFIAKNRYKFFGHRNECMLPTPELKQRFLN